MIAFKAVLLEGLEVVFIVIAVGVGIVHLYFAPPSHYRSRIMNIFSDVAKELLNMFMADARLALSILGLVVFIALLIKVAGIATLLAGGGLLTGCPIFLVSAAYREAKKHALVRSARRAA